METQTNIVGGPKSNPAARARRSWPPDTLEGNDVYNSAGEELGSIKDIMIDVPRGRVAYAVLSRGGVLGIGDKLFAIPWKCVDAGHRPQVLRAEHRRRKR